LRCLWGVAVVIYMCLGPTAFPTGLEGAYVVNARVPGALLVFKADQGFSAVFEAVGRGPYDDRCARTEGDGSTVRPRRDHRQLQDGVSRNPGHVERFLPGL
jgi:hypothetical protein